MTFGNYIYQDNTSQSRQAAINQLIDTADNLEAGHLKAVETASTLKQTIGTLPFNENEEELRQSLLAELENAINNNIQYGNMYYALDDITKLGGDLFTRKDVTSALRNQNSYNLFMNELEKSTNIPEQMKEMYKEKNPYNRIAIEKDGNVVGYKDWQVGYRPAKHVDGLEWFDRALKRTMADTTGVSSVKYYDSDNKEVKIGDGSNISSIKMYDVFGNQVEQVTYEKLLSSFLGLYKNDPTVAASVKDEIEYAKWAKEHGDYTDYGVYNTNKYGIPTDETKSLAEYLIWKFEQSAHGSIYSKILNEHKIGFNKDKLNGSSGLTVDQLIQLLNGNYDDETVPSGEEYTQGSANSHGHTRRK